MKTQKAKLMMMPMTLATIALSGCTGQSIPPSAADPNRAVNVELVRKKQRVVRYNCQHRIVSDSLEETSSPTQLLEL